jgi:hypothetical protein
MDVKPSSFIVSLVSLLGVVLPGSIVTFLALSGPWRPSLPNAFMSFQSDTAASWVIFVVTSYIVGQALYGFGSWFLDSVYDRTYRRYKQLLKGEPKDFVRPLVKAQFPKGPRPSTYSWARAYVVTRSPGSVNELDQIEADFKFFRSLALVFLVAPFELRLLPNESWFWILMSGLALMVVGSVADAAVDLVERRRRLLTKKKAKGQGAQLVNQIDPARSSRALDLAASLTGIGVAIVLVEGAVLIYTVAGIPGAGAFLVGFAVVFLLFCQQRWQRNETTYEYAATIGATSPVTARLNQPVEQRAGSSSDGGTRPG